jgi:hypothetical protein
MARPFTAVPLGFSVMGRDTLWWGGCAWDSFALPHLLPDQGSMLVATTCPACDRAHAWRLDDREPPAGGQVAHFWFRRHGRGMTSSTPAGTSGSSAPRAAWLSGSTSQDTSVAPFWTCRRCGGSRPVGMRATSSVAMSAASRTLLPTTCAVSDCQARSGPHVGVIDGGLPGVPVIRPGLRHLPTRRLRLDHPKPARTHQTCFGSDVISTYPRHRPNRAAAAWRSGATSAELGDPRGRDSGRIPRT